MKETIWNFGYRCKISKSECFWFGTVYVPRWHPVRGTGLVCQLVLMIGGEWNVFIDPISTRREAIRETFRTAGILRGMQEKWDSLSPYERTYRV